MTPGRAKNPGAVGRTGVVPTGETVEERKRRAHSILRRLRKDYPDADCALQHVDAFQLLVATILSAQSTDATVNRVTPELFRRYPGPRELAEAPAAEIEKLVHPTGFFRQKARSIRGASARIATDFGGEVPRTMEDLTSLPGVARKTANVVLGTAFGINEGVVVDTHIGRLSVRLGLTWTARDDKDAVRIEQDLVQLFPRREWSYLGHALIRHGREVCTSRKALCDACGLSRWCPSAGKVGTSSTNPRA